MQRKLFLIACITFLLISTRCLPLSVEDSKIGGTASSAAVPDKTPDIEGTASPTSFPNGEIQITTSPTSAQAGNSGIEGTTIFVEVSGVPGGATTEGPTSMEFAIAPVDVDQPIFERAIFIKSDAQGAFKVELPLGMYWIGPKEKALDPIHYAPGSIVFSEQVVEVKAGTFISVEIIVTGYAP